MKNGNESAGNCVFPTARRCNDLADETALTNARLPTPRDAAAENFIESNTLSTAIDIKRRETRDAMLNDEITLAIRRGNKGGWNILPCDNKRTRSGVTAMIDSSCSFLSMFMSRNCKSDNKSGFSILSL